MRLGGLSDVTWGSTAHSTSSGHPATTVSKSEKQETDPQGWSRWDVLFMAARSVFWSPAEVWMRVTLVCHTHTKRVRKGL